MVFGIETKPITILHVIAHIEKGGAERQLSLLVAASKNRHIISVLPGNEGPSKAIVELLPGLSPAGIFKRVRELIRKYDVDIVQLWLPDRITIPAMLAARLEGCRIISGDRRRVRNRGIPALRDRLPYVNHLSADLVIPNYPHLLPPLSLRRLLQIPKRTLTILNGIDLTPMERPVGAMPTRLLFVGRLVEQKRVGELIDTLPALRETTGITGLDIVGEGHLESDYHARITAHGLEAHVKLHGRLSDWGGRFSPEQNMLILPSTSEGMSNTLFEAIAWGFLPLVSRSPELDVILQDWLHKPEMFDPWRPETVIAAIDRALTNTPQQIENRIRSMQNRLADFSVAEMAAAYDAVYRRLLTLGPET